MPGNTLFSIGEALIDMIPSRVGCAFDEVPSFSPRTGGAPANVCAAFARLGGASSFLTQLGDDPFGHKIARALAGCGVELVYTEADRTCVLRFTDPAMADGRTERRVQLNAPCRSLRVVGDRSSLEIFLNEGAAVFSTRYYPAPGDVSVKLTGAACELCNL